MMRWLAISILAVSLAACSKAPDGSGSTDLAGNTASAAADVAFTYAYSFRLPSARIADAQEEHARACEQLGSRCRITGMTYRVDDAGTVAASLDVKLAAPIARAFGRAGTQAVERAGGALTGADVGGTDAQPATDEAQAGTTQATAERDRIARELARADLPARERAVLRNRQAAVEDQGRAAGSALAAARASVATTPMSFAYHAGTGIGLSAKLADAWQTAVGSVGLTIGFALTVLAALGPPALLLLALLLLWRRFGRPIWMHVSGTASED